MVNVYTDEIENSQMMKIYLHFLRNVSANN